MTLDEAFAQLIQSEEYKNASKGQTSEARKYRQYATRYSNGELKSGAIVEMLIKHDYQIRADKVTKKKKS